MYSYLFFLRRTLVSYLDIVLLKTTATRASGVNNVCQKIQQLHGLNVMVGVRYNRYNAKNTLKLKIKLF